MEFHLRRLHQRLDEFGLNPTDWRMEVQARRGALAKIEISLRTDRQIKLEGWAHRNAWLTLTFLEL
jgi:hypothetical protein